jgi:LPS sulfotransferase NodH
MKPFVIVGMPRTGSTLLSTGLDQHPQVRCFGELFHPVDNERANVHALKIDGQKVSFDPQKVDAIKFLEQNVFSAHNNDRTTVGFKLFGDYAKGPGSENLFRRLRDEIPNIHIIHIFRRNYLEVLASLETAMATEQWVIFSGTNDNVKIADPIRIEPDSALRFFTKMREMDLFYETYFNGGQYFKVAYEELDQDYQYAMAICYEFFGLPPNKVMPRTLKQRSASLRDRIANYDELALHFRNGPFSASFREEEGDEIEEASATPHPDPRQGEKGDAAA